MPLLSNTRTVSGVLDKANPRWFLGLSYKAGISDTRDSPSLKLVEHLLLEGARIKAYDPNVDKLNLGSVELCSDVRSCLAGSDCCIITTRKNCLGGSLGILVL